MSNQTTNVFVSYSHTDAPLVAPVVKLLRANKSLVFQDVDSIQPGKMWRNEIAKGLAESDMVVVFWCTHASDSDEVCREWKAAIEQKKDLLPLLLDATPLPPELGDFQWIDFRVMVGTSHASIVSPPDKSFQIPEAKAPPAEAMPRARGFRRSWLTMAATAAVVIGVGLTFFTLSERPEQSVPHVHVPPSVQAPAGTTHPASAESLGPWFGLILAILAVTGCLAWLLRRRMKRKRPVEATPIRLPDISQIAREIEQEILRRTADHAR